MRTMQSDRQRAENCNRVWDMQTIRSSLTNLQGGASVGTPWLPVEDMERRSPISEYIISPSISQTTTNCGPFLRIK